MYEGAGAMINLTAAGHRAAKLEASAPGPTSAVQLIWAVLVLASCVILLITFYNVTRDAVSRAHTHWARAIEHSATCTWSAATEQFSCQQRTAAMEPLVVSQLSSQ